MSGTIPYDTIAELYDRYVQTELDVPFFLDAAQTVRGEILELMCGTGRVSLPLVRAGARLTCVDYSAEMIAIFAGKLREHHLQADLHVADVRGLDLRKTFELILIPFHAFAEITDIRDQRRALERIRAHLSEDGQFICTLHNPRVRRKTIDGQLHLAGTHPLANTGKLLFWMMQSYLQAERVVSLHEFFEEYDASGVMRQRRHVELQFALIEHHEFLELAESAGFALQVVYGSYDKAPFEAETSPFIIAVMTQVGTKL